MPKIANKDFLVCAEVMVAALLCHADRHTFAGHCQLSDFEVKERSICVKATPTALLAMIDFYTKTAEFPTTQKTVAAFRAIATVNRYSAIRDTLTRLGKGNLGLTDEQPRTKGKPIPGRVFCLQLDEPCPDRQDMVAVMQWFRQELTERTRHQKARLAPEFREAQKKLFQFLDQAICLFPESLADFTRSQRQQLTFFLPYLHSALEQSLYLEASLHGKLALNLAKFYLATGKSELALPLLERCLTINEVSKTNGYHYLGVFYLSAGNLHQAANYYQKALKLRLQRSNSVHFAVSATYLGLANTFMQLGEFEQADHYITSALSRQELSSLLLADAHRLWGEIRIAQQRWAESWLHFEQALQFCDTPNEKNIATFAACMRGRGRWWALKGMFEKAGDDWQIAITALEDYDHEHYLLPWLLADLAGMWVMLENLEEARRNYETALGKATSSGTVSTVVVSLILQGLDYLDYLDRRQS